jgi:hypothetical protein
LACASRWGGYGALLVAERLSGREPKVLAVAAVSPAIFASYADAVAASPTSFDSPADVDSPTSFDRPAGVARHDVVAHATGLQAVPRWIGRGTADPFEPQSVRLRARFTAVTSRAPSGGILPGCQDDACWGRRNLPTALSFLAEKPKRDAKRVPHRSVCCGPGARSGERRLANRN